MIRNLKHLKSAPIVLVILLIAFVSCNKSVDQEGNNFKTIDIKNQSWMAENLNVSHFRNGDTIHQILSNDEWINAGINKIPAWCYYNNDPEMGKKYGKLYNWYAVHDPRNLAPKGWRVPSDSDWGNLVNKLGGDEIAGYKMKSDVGWEPYRTRTYEPFKSGNGSNETSFNAKPAGGRFIDAFFSEGSFTYWWSSSEDDDLNSFNRKLMSDGKIIQRPSYSNTMGLSIRCVKGE